MIVRLISDKNIAVRLQKASRAYGALQSRLWSQRGIQVKSKVKVYKAVILTTLLYGSQSWTLYKRNVQDLQKFHLRSLRQILRISWSERVSNTEVLERAEMTGIACMLIRRQLKWVGHITRMDNRRLPKQVLFWSTVECSKKSWGSEAEVQRYCSS